MKSLSTAVTVFALTAVVACMEARTETPQEQREAPPALNCTPAGPLARLGGVPEASGIAVSRRAPGQLWVINDSGAPLLSAIDTNGKPVGRVVLEGADLVDWEALASGPCGGGHCLYIGDIGDNGARRRHVTVYRAPEPDPSDASAAATAFHAAYPDGAHDAETLLVAPDGTLHIVTKGDTGPVALYRFPHALAEGVTMRLERVGEPMSGERPPRAGRITDGAVSADGTSVLLRSLTALTRLDAATFFEGNWDGARTTGLQALNEPQGEAVAFGDGDTIYLAGEGGGGGAPGTLAALTCGG